MSVATEPAQTKTYCVNHPQTETLLRCNKCGKPVCLKCVQRTPVGYRCNECLGLQRAGYYNATTFDYALAAVIGIFLGALGGFVMLLIGGFWIVAIFAGPIAGGIISEVIRRVISKRRGRYVALVACAAVAAGGLGMLLLPALPLLLAGVPGGLVRVLFNIGFWIFLALALSTTYARLRI
jgi:MFS family permease